MDAVGRICVADVNNHVVKRFIPEPRAQVIVHVYDDNVDLYPKLDDLAFHVSAEGGTLTTYGRDDNGNRTSKSVAGGDAFGYSYMRRGGRVGSRGGGVSEEIRCVSPAAPEDESGWSQTPILGRAGQQGDTEARAELRQLAQRYAEVPAAAAYAPPRPESDSGDEDE